MEKMKEIKFTIVLKVMNEQETRRYHRRRLADLVLKSIKLRGNNNDGR